MAERPEDLDVETPDPMPSGAAGVGAAMAAALGRRIRGVKADPKLDAFLDEQTRLARLQTEHLHEQRAVILARLRLGRFSDWMKALLQVMTALVGLAIVIAITVMAWQAHEDHGVTIDAFTVPPDLAQRGLTSQAVAREVQDRLSELQAKTVTGRPASTYANDWGDDIKVEIPETGVSIGELNRYLRQWLGSETRISGEVVRTPAGLAVTVRAGDAPGRRIEGPEANIDKLIGQAAETVYAETQPYRHAVYLASEGETDQALQAYVHLADDSGADPKDRAWAYTGWATLLLARNDLRGALARAMDAIKLDPMVVPAYPIQATAENQLGWEAENLGTARAELRVLQSGGVEGASREQARLKRGYLNGGIATYFGDNTPMLKALQRVPEAETYEGAGSYSFRDALVGVLADLHDIAGARRLLSAGPPPGPVARENLAFRLDDWSTALSATNQQIASSGSTPLLQANRARLLTHLARIAEAQAVIAPTALDCTDCLEARGEIAARTGDRKGDDRWFGGAVKQAPFPDEYLAWGQSLLILGDHDAAIEKLKEAHRLGPHYADPLEVWGEALMAKRDYAGAITKFAEADKDAPKWGRNHLRWGEALMLSGRYAAARAQYQIANGLDLSVGDRAALNVLLARTASGPLHG